MVEFNGTTAVLRDRYGHFTTVALSQLLAAAGETSAAGDVEDGEAYSQLLAVEGGADEVVLERAAHVREVLTGYRSGSEDLAGEGELRELFDPGLPKGQRYQAKAAELGVSVATVRGWVARYQKAGEAGLVDRRRTQSQSPLAGLDPRWLDTCRAVIDEHTGQSTPTKNAATRPGRSSGAT